MKSILDEWIRRIDALPVIPARRCDEIRGEVVSHGARITTNCWSGVICPKILVAQSSR